MTDRSLGNRLWLALDRIPSGGGVVLRHHDSDLAFARRVAAQCTERGLTLAVAGDAGLARRIGAAMVHNPVDEADGLIVSRSVHTSGEALAARSAQLVFISPLFATSSHPGRPGLGVEVALALARRAAVPAIALGGMDPARGEAVRAMGFYGWAAISAWLEPPSSTVRI